MRILREDNEKIKMIEKQIDNRKECIERWESAITNIVKKYSINSNITEWNNFDDIFNVLSYLVANTRPFVSLIDNGWLDVSEVSKDSNGLLKLSHETVKPLKLTLYIKDKVDELSCFQLLTDDIKPLLESNNGKEREEVFILKNNEVVNIYDVEDNPDFDLDSILKSRYVFLKKRKINIVSMYSIYEKVYDGKIPPKSEFEGEDDKNKFI